MDVLACAGLARSTSSVLSKPQFRHGFALCAEVISPNKNWFLWSDNVDQLQEWIDLITHQCRLRCTSVSTSVMDNDSWLDQ